MNHVGLVRCLLFAAGCVLAGAAVLGQSSQAPVPRMNILAVLTDDQGAWTIGAYGNTEVQTPNIDRLAREGARFANAFVTTPVCSPSRATFLTGLYPNRMGIGDYIGLEAQNGVGLPEWAKPWPESLKQNGYATALIGKWHLGILPEFHPTRRGFDHFYGFLDAGSSPMNPLLERDGKKVQEKGYIEDMLTDDAIQFITENRSRPFAVVLATRAPHLPFGPVPEVDSAVYKNLDPTIPNSPGLDIQQVKSQTREYYASVHSIDRNLGRLLAKLAELGLEKNTVVVFMSDHGFMIGQHSLLTKGNAWSINGGVTGPRRPNMFEESIRTPLLVRWPGVVKPGTVIDRDISNLDIYSSLLDIAGVTPPDEPKRDGLDFVPLLRGQTVPWRDASFGEYDMHNSALAFMRMIRTKKWKYVRFYFTNLQDELYDMEADPKEQNNLAWDPKNTWSPNPAYQPVVKELQGRLMQWQRSIDDPILRPEYTPLEPANHRAERAAPAPH
jgi:arylsulfatase A-like enzyme